MNTAGSSRIEKTPDVCGGQARIRDTRVAVWILVLRRKAGEADANVLHSYPTLTQADLDAAWDYYQHNPVEVEQSIWINDTAANIPESVPPPAAVILLGWLLGLSEDTIREAFEPPLTPAQIDAAWAEYRAFPVNIGRDLAALRQAG